MRDGKERGGLAKDTRGWKRAVHQVAFAEGTALDGTEPTLAKREDVTELDADGVGWRERGGESDVPVDQRRSEVYQENDVASVKTRVYGAARGKWQMVLIARLLLRLRSSILCLYRP